MPRVHVLNGAQKGQVFLIRPPGPYRFGRNPRTEFPLFDRRASRRHFRIDFRDQGYLLTDLGSLGGTYVNDRRVETAILGANDTIRAGDTHFLFDLETEADEIVGKELAGYHVLEQVGAGGMGTVYRAKQRTLARVVALKVLPENIALDHESSARFIHEARAAAKLSHSSVVRVYDVNLVDDVLFYAMEYMARGNLLDLLRSKGRLSIPQAVAIALDIARAVEYADRLGIVHRDIKPANLLVHQNGSVKLSDLGIATYRGEPADPSGSSPGDPSSDNPNSSRPSPSGKLRICGSPHYMAPEQVLGRDADTSTDIYALGATLYQLLSGQPPFPFENVTEILKAHIHKKPAPLEKLRPELPSYVAALVEEMMAKEGSQRPGPVAQLVARLEAIAEVVGDRDPLEIRRQRGRRFRNLLLVLAAVLGTALGYAVARSLL